MMTEEQHLQALCETMNWPRETGERYVSLADGIHNNTIIGDDFEFVYGLMHWQIHKLGLIVVIFEMAVGGVHPALISRLATIYSIRHDAR